ncbi:pyrimidine-nucleoside phosphorylase [Catellicoccus marimammalium]|uniref:Pyrimidine-nucleoside phosphorylase n=1 Tax=Catellicoccus marimammalium M35/04/3 TaxID=1234409 RepID=K8ZA81_9ENTE|nr:pyrimidine-nucleoside phosphorylase [Catellicoccus marimammalium]EKU26947.1 Pyrimidine-nucleoside phosphorylase [Catellicoccus marimammalium M35/04/3]
MRMVDLIIKKRDGKALSTEEIQYIIEGYTKGEIPDYQMSALTMAIYMKGMNTREQGDLTMAMVHSGDVIDLSAIEGIKVDKHSTGGVGDTTTLILAPLVASAGAKVAKMSGRGLGHTGGTLDKLESIPGFHIELTEEQFIDQVNTHNIAVMGQSGDLTPADKKLYALRDVTGTVESIPLIASSIMSKKIAAGADAIVLDVKTGAGAFMKTKEDAEALAHAMVNIGNAVGRKTMAIISDMSQPLGKAIGNALEVEEAILTLQGKGPKDLTDLVLTLGSQMLVLAQKADSLEEAREILEASLHNGKAIEKFKEWIRLQGGDDSVVEDMSRLPQAPYTIDVPAWDSGYVTKEIADHLGQIAMKLGAGRATKEEEIDPSVGIYLHKKVGDPVTKGEPLLTLYAHDQEVSELVDEVKECITIGSRIEDPILIHEVIVD